MSRPNAPSGQRATPLDAARTGWGKFRRWGAKVLPDSVVTRLRARRATRHYLKTLGYELIERETRIEDLEGRVAARRDGFYERIVKEVLERTEIVLQELDRRIEGLSARSGERLNAVEEQLVELREELGRLRSLSSAEVAASEKGDAGATPHVDAGDAADTTLVDPGEAGSDLAGNGQVAAAEHATTTADSTTA